MTAREKYDLVVKYFALAPAGSFPIFDVELPPFMEDDSKTKYVEGDYVFNYVLTDKATDKDRADYVDYIMDYTGQDLDLYIIEDDKDEKDMDTEEKIKSLLKAYGAKDAEIANFMKDLRGEAKTEKSKADVYKAIKEKGGSELIIKLASMPKEEREKAIADYLK